LFTGISGLSKELSYEVLLRAKEMINEQDRLEDAAYQWLEDHKIDEENASEFLASWEDKENLPDIERYLEGETFSRNDLLFEIMMAADEWDDDDDLEEDLEYELDDDFEEDGSNDD
jgi:hypothetical protein